MARPFWKGTLTFGLVEIGVTLRPVRATDELSFSLLDRNDFAPVGYKRYNKRTGREVPFERVVRGFEYEPDQYVVLTDDELHQANAEASQTIELVQFVNRSDIDPIYFETPYFIEPSRKSSRSYALLRATLQKTQLVGIVRVVLRTRQHTAALIVHDGVMMLDLLRYSEELRTPTDLAVPLEPGANGRSTSAKSGAGRKLGASDAKPAPLTVSELKMASLLVEEMREPWKPETFKDEYRRDVMALIKKKIRSGKTHEIVADAPERTSREPREIVDLMPLLKQSLGRRGKGTARSSTSQGIKREPAKPAAKRGSAKREIAKSRKRA